MKQYETIHERCEEYDRERKEHMKQYETIHEGCEEYDRERKENMKLHTKGMKSTYNRERKAEINI
jgi:hypothetical protein